MLQLSNDVKGIIAKALQFKTTLDPFTTNELFLKWKSLNNIDDINQYLNIGIDIIKLQNKYDRNIKKSYSLLNQQFMKYLADINNNTCINYLSLAKTTHLNNVNVLESIYNQITVDSQTPFSCLRYCGELQCNDMDLISNLIDHLHDKITDEQLNQYLFCLFVLFPPEQSTLFLNLVRNKKIDYLTPQNFLLLSQLFQSKNLEIPNSWNIIQNKSHEIKQSQLQKEVQLLLNMVNLQYEQEKFIDELYQIDFYLPQSNQVLEVNGPQHYVYDIEQNNRNFLNLKVAQIFTGKHYYKQMCLTTLGYDVRNICFLEFYKARGVTAKLQYLKTILD